MMAPMRATHKKRVLFICYSLSGQTNGLLLRLAAGMDEEGVEVVIERLRPLKPIRFPLGSTRTTIAMMLITFFRNLVPIAPLSEKTKEQYDLIILAGPTWSYHPSGPILSLLKFDGKRLFPNQTVLPVISCRGYWRMHWWGLKTLLKKSGATVSNMIVFSHPSSEPWRTIGVFLKLAGRVPERNSWISKYYHKYGHTRGQIEEARLFGNMIGQTMNAGRSLDELDFKTPVAIP